MDADTSEKIRDVISFVHSRTLSIGVYSPGDISVTNMYEEAASDLAEVIQQEIAKAKEQERSKIIEEVQVNQNGQFEEDSTGNVCWYLDVLVETLKEHKG